MADAGVWVLSGVGYADGNPSRYRLETYLRWTAQDVSGNRTYVEGMVQAIQTNNLYYNNLATGWSISGAFTASGAWATGSGSWGTKVLWQGGAWFANAADGSISGILSASTAVKSPAGAVSASGAWVGFPLIRVAPGAPTNVVLDRSSDTQMSVSWTRNEPGNGPASSYDIQTSVNDGVFGNQVAIAPASSLVMACAANQKVRVQVRAFSAAGASAWTQSNLMWTTPAAPSNVTAIRGDGLSVTVSWIPRVAYIEHQHQVWHGVVGADGLITWDVAAVATLPAGISSWVDVDPDTSKVHVYAVSAQTTSTEGLSSAHVQSNSVLLLAPPNAPSIRSRQYVDRGSDINLRWTHHPVDTTGQTAFEVEYSTDGGVTWSTTGKTVSTSSSWMVAAGMYPANTALTWRVRTWGQADMGGSDGVGGSPWSTQTTTVFKSAPMMTVLAPVATVTQATLVVSLGFSQAEGASPVRATIGLYQDGMLVEEVATTTLPATTFTTRLIDQGSYEVRATTIDSNGLTSAQVVSAFTVDYVDPVPATVVTAYLAKSGRMQLDLTIPTPGSSQAEAIAVSITRSIDGGTSESILEWTTIPEDGLLTVLDMLPTIHGENVYQVTTWSADGAAFTVTVAVTTSEDRWVFLSSGDRWQSFISFFGNLSLGSTPTRDAVLVKTAGRSRPIALFGENRSFDVSGSATIVAGGGSTVEEVERFLLDAGRVCYRDPSGRRIFGTAKGSISGRTSRTAGFAYTVSEAD